MLREDYEALFFYGFAFAAQPATCTENQSIIAFSRSPSRWERGFFFQGRPVTMIYL